MLLSGKKIFITAAGQGIGRAITERFIKEEGSVLATDVNYELIKDIETEKKQLDVLNKTELQKTISNFNPDILINCAGFVHAGTILDANDEEFEFAVSLNIKSMFHSIQAAIPLMIQKGGGSIINISSVVSSIIGAPNRFIYGTTKAGVIGLTKSVAVEYVKEGIRCNAICPGFVKTNHGLSEIVQLDKLGQNWNEEDLRTVQGRLCDPFEVANAVLYLASDQSSFVNGNAFYIDNGWYSKG